MEDNKPDVFIVREAIQNAEIAATLEVVADGESAIRFLNGVDSDESSPAPDLVILDLNLPRKSGIEVLRQLRATRRSARARVLVVTSSDAARDHEETTRLGADQYFRKPSRYDAFLKLGEIVREMLSAG